VYVRKSDGSPAVRIGSGGFGTDISPDGKWALIVMPGDPAARVQIVPVGAGQPKVLHWDGFQPTWAHWFPDGQHIIMRASGSDQKSSTYITDANAAAPKYIGPTGEFPGIAPDGHSYITVDNGKPVLKSLASDAATQIPNEEANLPDERAIGWTSDSQHAFVGGPVPGGLNIYRFDLQTGKRELWQTIKPKDQIGLMPMNSPIAITPDGRWMAFTYTAVRSQIYRSDTMK
jgi:Tol biopolymer transport system component